jgi:nitric oxide reductase subunit B
MEYWRWWIVHLWVEGFFEVFATTALAFIFSTMGLVSQRMATTASLASASLFLLGGIPGTFHHMYFAGTTTPVMAVGASFSALEVVPLIVLGHEAWEHWQLKARSTWMQQLYWPLMFFVAVAFWNMLGAGVFGFMINPPNFTLLCPRIKYDSNSCSCCFIWSLWVSGSWFCSFRLTLYQT